MQVSCETCKANLENRKYGNQLEQNIIIKFTEFKARLCHNNLRYNPQHLRECNLESVEKRSSRMM